MQQVVNELHKAARKNFPRRRTIIKGFDDLWQADLAEFIPYAKENKGYKYILVVIDCFSKYLWTRGLKTKTGEEVTKAVQAIFKSTRRRPKNLQTDAGKEFYNKSFAKLMMQERINHYSTYSTKKAALAERVIRSIKNPLYRQFSLRGKYVWIDAIESITSEYNNRKHRTTGMKPIEVKADTKLDAYNHIKLFNNKKCRFNVGDVVRISKFKSIFAKGYTPNWSSELFKIIKVQITNPVTYLLEDMKAKPILGGFYEHELQKAKYSDVYLVEKVLRRKKDKVYVKWLGLDEKSWIDKNNVVL
uniref:Integrase catalytic domain-containing protein n=1 Tax=Photinus pyralis TaxID=7054 RepID=A0A1Y1MVM7_PHOPY